MNSLRASRKIAAALGTPNIGGAGSSTYLRQLHAGLSSVVDRAAQMYIVKRSGGIGHVEFRAGADKPDDE